MFPRAECCTTILLQSLNTQVSVTIHRAYKVHQCFKLFEHMHMSWYRAQLPKVDVVGVVNTNPEFIVIVASVLAKVTAFLDFLCKDATCSS